MFIWTKSAIMSDYLRRKGPKNKFKEKIIKAIDTGKMIWYRNIPPIIRRRFWEPLAQTVEQLPFKQWVTGSIPVRLTILHAGNSYGSVFAENKSQDMVLGLNELKLHLTASSAQIQVD